MLKIMIMIMIIIRIFSKLKKSKIATFSNNSNSVKFNQNSSLSKINPNSYTNINKRSKKKHNQKIIIRSIKNDHDMLFKNYL
jgi:hypothetical protein